MEMVAHEDEPEKSAFSDSTADATVRGDASRSRSARDSEVPAAAPGVKLYRLVAVILGLLCILQAALNISLRLALYTEASCKNVIEERDEMEKKLNISVSQYNSLTEERDELERKLNTSVSQYNSLTEERDKLKRAVKTPGWVYFSNSVYYISATKKTWQGSREDCLQKGADLMIIDSKEEQDFMRHLKGNVWIGLSDRETEGTWRWVDGTPLETSYWADHEPNGHKKEDCGEVIFHDMKRKWNDKRCDHSNFWVCEMKMLL